MKIVILVLSVFLVGCVQNTTRETDIYLRVSCSGANAGFFQSLVGGGSTQYKQVVSTIELTADEAYLILDTFECGEQADLVAIRNILGE